MFEKYTKPKDEPLLMYECIQLLTTLVDNGIVQKDPNEPNNIAVYREADGVNPEGWYSQNLHEAANELLYDKEGQRFLLDELANRNIPMVFENWLNTNDHLSSATFIKGTSKSNDIER